MIFALAVILLANVFVVKEGEYRVVRQFGEITRIVKEPGLNMKIPFIQSVSSLPKNQMKHNVSEAEIATKDKSGLSLITMLSWKINDAQK